MTTQTHILIVDDDAEIRDLLQAYLQRNGYTVSSVEDGEAMWKLLDRKRVDLIVLDLMLPGEDGLSLCRKLRTSSEMPIVMLTALGDEMDRIVGLEMGADDYLPKPFNPRELLARIKGVLRRSDHGGGDSEKVRFADWTFDRAARHLISPDGVVTALSTGEYRLLEAFVQHPNRVMTRDQLMDEVQGRDWDPLDRSIDVQVSRLRRRLRDDAHESALIKTVRGEGYFFNAKVSRVK